MKKLTFILLGTLSLQSLGAALTDGNAYTFISGASGSHPTQEWLGGKNGVIDSGVNGATFTRTNWTYLFDDRSYWTYDTARKLSRSKALYYIGTRDGDDPRGTAFYDWGVNGYKEEYYSGNYYVTVVNSPTQFKMRRWNSVKGVEDGGDWNSSTQSWDPNVHGVYIMPQVYRTGRFDGSTALIAFGDRGGAYPSPNAGVYYPDAAWQNGAWFRYESYIRQSSGVGVADGMFWERVTNISTGAIIGENTYTGMTLNPVEGQHVDFRYSVLQNFFGNDSADANSTVSMDDIYLAASTTRGANAWRRVDLCTAASGTRKCVIQPFTKSGNSVTVTVNKSYITQMSGLYFVEYDENNNIITTDGPHTFGIPGDVNGDGQINLADLLLLQQYLMNQTTLSPDQLTRADVYPANGDGNVTFSDWLTLQQKVLNLAQ